MVFLRLSVKVFPREQLSSSSSSSWGRTLLGARKSTNDDSSQGSGVSTTLKKPGVFLLVLEHPEEVSLGGLAGIIQEHWGKLHPELEPLSIKKILDDTKEDIDLYPDLTVADVWVDYGKARADGLDQRGSVRVLQKPTSAAPERFPSVDQDWDAAIASYEHKRAMKDKKEAMERQFPAIQEENEESGESGESRNTHSRSLSQSHIEWEHSPGSPQPINNEPHASAQKSPVVHRHRDLPVSSVEIRSPVTTPPSTKSVGPTIAGTPPPRRESEELGGSPSPAERRTSSALSHHTPAPVVSASSESQSKPQKSVKLPIPSRTAKRKITQMPDDVESPPMSAPKHVIPHQETQSTEEATASSSDGESDSAPQIAEIILKQGMPNGVNGRGHLAAVPTSVSESLQQRQAETVVAISSEESSEEDSDSEDDKIEAKKMKTAEQNQRATEDQTGSDASDSDSDSVSESESESDSDASEENGPKDAPVMPQIDHSTPIILDGGVIDAEGDIQMEEPIVTSSSQSSDQSDVSMSKTNGTHETRSRKRKQASEEPTSVKEARQAQAHPSTRPPSTPPRSVPAVIVHSQHARQSESKSPAAQTTPQRRPRAPSFSSPARQASVREENKTSPKPLRSGIGLGITQSPSSHQPVVDLSQESNVTSTQHSFGGPLFPSSNATGTAAPSFTSVNNKTPAIDRTKKSAIRAKDSPAAERRSVSFAEGENLASSFDPVPGSTPRSTAISSKSTPITKTKGTPSSATPRNATPKTKSAQQTPTPAVKTTLGTPSTSSKPTSKARAKNQTPKSTSKQTQIQSSDEVVYPPGFDIDQLTQEVEIEKKIRAQSKAQEKAHREKEQAEMAEIERKIPETYDPHLALILTDMQTILQKLSNTRMEVVRRIPLRVKLDALREDLKACEQKLEAKKSTPRQPIAKQAVPTLKEILSSQRQEIAARQRPEPKPAPAPRNDVYEVPSSGESESESDSSSDDDSESDSDSGDIMPDGQAQTLRKPRTRSN
ncbi:KEN domain ribonuclease activator [Penicillium cf. griseofulvum]|nr:KEN domain ribonuclease activator [Penicillium cf. griseofulvum]